jgi:hypothetical protein
VASGEWLHCAEHIGRSAALVFVVAFGRLPRLCLGYGAQVAVHFMRSRH